ncbi:MAG TPA: FHA domain-containing protein [Kiritimatiellia bacterium]|jgi:hypothetical protein|nr:FHA domain-containing protein [Kiritimatiellia bacterium]HOR97177.1 FHA domain-containing protein [Kiritimatiellia bacterium]HPW74558.1 FHA domain-containing protein [Kiritimatiellia bacterium]
MFCLKVEKGEPAGEVHILKEGENTLGRSRSATFRLGASDVSGQHARIVVRGGVVTVENLSQFGTKVDGTPITGSVQLTEGQRLSMGESTVLCLLRTPAGEPSAGADMSAAEPDVTQTKGTLGVEAILQARADEIPTGEGVPPSPETGGATRATPPPPPPPAQVAAAAPTGAEFGAPVPAYPDSDLTSGLPLEALTVDSETIEGATRAMQTRAATPEEIEHLRIVEQKRHKKRITRALAVLIPLIALVVIFRPRTPPPEPKIEWAKDEEGNYLDLFEAAPSGGLAEGGYDLCYPGPVRFDKTVTEDGVILSGFVGRERNVPMRLITQEQTDPKFVTMDRLAFVEEWIQQQKADNKRWSFDKPSPMPGFIGIRNGIPYLRVTYYRDDDEGSWFGVASVFRYGYRRIVIRAEAPASERVRLEDLLSSKFMRASEAMEYAYWEAPEELPKQSEAVLLKQAEADLNRMAPATWFELQRNLSGLLARTVLSGNKTTEVEALRLLVRLRERLTLWFNSQQLAFDAARMQNNRGQARETARLTRAVFKDMEDQRYYTVRKWNTEF